ncbi:MAG: YciI family protein [Gordonia sp. (in: high G+C Gram-positive bacteria)]|uniref:YciI family protein n=1 Tax=Gordonia sp. (in: high G+C Gram-positive bacteria) TaxID=84139 RepID=UPI0039E3B55F
MPTFAVEYTYDPAAAALRDEHRPAHRRFLGEGHEAGRVLLSGPYADGTGALLMIAADDEQAVADYLATDPFALVGAIGATRITAWTQVYGPF